LIMMDLRSKKEYQRNLYFKPLSSRRVDHLFIREVELPV